MKKPKNRQKYLDIMLIMAIFAGVSIVALFAWIVYADYLERKTVNYEPAASSFVQVTEPTATAAPPKTIALPKNPVDFNDLSKQNQDLYAWIKVPNTIINYPVAQSAPDMPEDFYLESDIYKQYYFDGTIYTQKINSKNFDDPVTILYGHNLLNGTMFSQLHYFESEAFFDENRYFYIYIRGRILKYYIFAAFDYDDRHIMYSFDFNKTDIFLNYLEETLNFNASNAFKRPPPAEFQPNDKIVILSTCSNINSNGRYLVHGVLVDEEITT